MGKEKFDDETLVRVAKGYYISGCYDADAVKVLNSAGSTLSIEERNILVRYVDKYQSAMFSHLKSGISMRQMRDALLTKIGRKDLIESGCSYAANINAAQLRAIYLNVMDLEELKSSDE